jgi:hypothetical protein
MRGGDVFRTSLLPACNVFIYYSNIPQKYKKEVYISQSWRFLSHIRQNGVPTISAMGNAETQHHSF